jgi:hypothetical protein
MADVAELFSDHDPKPAPGGRGEYQFLALG